MYLIIYVFIHPFACAILGVCGSSIRDSLNSWVPFFFFSMKFFCFDYIARVYLAQPKLSKETTQMSGKSQVPQLE